tara:strand:+ start:3543 stop:5000 length:1458 start_codon:yes stop_codon:yes gene_type:complete
MKLLKEIINNIRFKKLIGNDDCFIKKISFKSDECDKDYLFVAIKGHNVDGHNYINSAISFGATVIICEDFPSSLKEKITYIQVSDTKEVLAKISSNFFGNPADKLKIIGVTGTNGKTTITTLLFNLFRSLKYNCGLISTIENRINEKIISTNSTTPDSIKIHELLFEMISSECTLCFIEVSSHGIDQKRTYGINFSFAVFSNISRDHLDYHNNLQDYVNTKKKLFDSLNKDSFSIINADDTYSKIMVSNSRSRIITYSIQNKSSDHVAEVLKNKFDGLDLKIDGHHLKTKISGYFNVYNLLAIYAVSKRIHTSKKELFNALVNLKNVFGRFNFIKVGDGINVLIDYAHSPGAIQSIFDSVLKLKSINQNIITVVGCGGNRDKGKRPQMGSISYKNSDIVIFTSDNPRDENIYDIINDMTHNLKEISEKKLLKIESRKEAISKSIDLAERNDIVLILGKGHEKFQEIRGEKFAFDDFEVLLNVFKN